MKAYEYTVTMTTIDEIRIRVAESDAGTGPPVLYCDSGGECYFDKGQGAYTGAVIETLNEYGERGWSLVQVVLRERDMIGFWRREKDT